MKIKHLIHFAFCFFLIQTSNAQVLLNDDFNGNSVDSSLWNVVLPFAQSQVTESGGYLTTTGRGILATVAGFNSPISVSGTVIMNDANEHFETTLRTDLSINNTPEGVYHELTGVSVEFAPDGTFGGISIQSFTPTNVTVLSQGSYSFIVGQTYNFTVTDDGNNITVAINGTPLLSATNTYTTGNKVAFYSREFPSTSSSLDSVTIADYTQIWLTNGLVAYYPFNGNANDESGNGRNAVVMGSGTLLTNGVNGAPNSRVLVRGSRQY